MRQLLTLILLVGTVLGTSKAWHLAKDGFLFRRALFPLIAQQSPQNCDEILPLLNQPFTFLGRGRQFYAFESADGKYVLKLPRYDSYCLPLWRRAISLPWIRTRAEVHFATSDRLHFLQESLQIALSQLKEETALIGVYLSQRNCALPPITLFDRCGRKHLFPANEYGFVLQKKVPLFIPIWQAALESGQMEEAKRIFDAFLHFIAARAEKGIYDKDATFFPNYAFDGTQVIQIDIGGFCQRPVDITDSIKPFRDWLERTHPEWVYQLEI